MVTYVKTSSFVFRRVHISRATLDCLNGQFNVEPGNGADRNSYLANNNIDTTIGSTDNGDTPTCGILADELNCGLTR